MANGERLFVWSMKSNLAHIIKKAKQLCPNLYPNLYPKRGIYILTDPKRAPNINEIINSAPKSANIIIRNHEPGQFAQLLPCKNRANIRATISARGAKKLKLGGIHIPNKHLKHFLVSNKWDLNITASAHNSREITKALMLGIDDILISPIFKSESPSAKKTLGPLRLAILARAFPNANLIALGGINSKTISRLKHTRIKSIAGVGFKKPLLRHERP